jgi:protein-disulfide isomerase
MNALLAGGVVVVLSGSALGAQPEAPKAAVAVVAGEQITSEQLEELSATQLARLRAEEYAIQRRSLEERIDQKVMEKEAAKRRIDVAELRRIEIDEKVRPVTLEEAQAVVEAASEQPQAGGPGPTVDQVRNRLRAQRQRKREDEYLKQLRQQMGVQVFLKAPRVTIDAGVGQARGPQAAPVSGVAWSDFQCPYCARLAPALRQIEQRYPGKTRFVFRDYPLPMHKDAAKAAEAARCAADQGKFWEMHDKLFESQKDLQIPALKRYAGEIGLKQADFDACLDSGRQAQAIQKDQQEGARYGVRGTPSLFVNGRVVVGGANPEALASLIDEELAGSQGRP